MYDQGGWLWALIDVGFVLLLAAALIYGIYTWRRRRNRTLERVRDAATRRAYEDSDGNARKRVREDSNRSLNADRRRSAR
jgi:Flp pilus assembly protein TadB